MMRALAVLILLVILLACYALMYAGWRRRARRNTAAVVAVAGDPSAALEDPADGVETAGDGIYVSTVSAASRLDRVTAGGLGVRARARMAVTRADVRWDREGETTVHVPASRLVGVTRASGMAGKAVGQQRLVMVSWRADDDSVYETGFLPQRRADGDALVAAVERLVVQPVSPPVPPESPATDGNP